MVTDQLWSSLQEAPRTVTVANTEEWLTRIAIGEAVGENPHSQATEFARFAQQLFTDLIASATPP